MAYIQPTSEVWLCANVPLDPSYDNQLTFTSGSGSSRVWDVSAQRAYFASKAVYHPTNFSIVKEREGVLRMSGEVSNYYGINYMYFVNPPFGSGITSKYFYAFVTEVEYVNPNTTLIYFEIDVYQTWANDIVWMESVIEREHVEHDEMYANLEDEGIEVNEMDPYAEVYLDDALGQKILVVGATKSYIDVVTEIEEGGYYIQYDYNIDYPSIQNTLTVDKFIALKDLYIFKDNQIINYNGFRYNHNSGEIIINGAQDVGFNRMAFKVVYTRSETGHTDVATWIVKGELGSNDIWTWSVAGEYVPYDFNSDYPDLSSLTTRNRILEISNIKGYSNGSQVNYFKAGYVYSDYAYPAFPLATFRLYFFKSASTQLLDEVDFQILVSQAGLTSTTQKRYAIHGEYSGNTWTFTGSEI